MCSHVPRWERELFFVPWDFIISDLWRTRNFIKITINFPSICGLWMGPPPWLIHCFPRLDWQAFVVKPLPLHHFDFYCTWDYIPLLMPSLIPELGREVANPWQGNTMIPRSVWSCSFLVKQTDSVSNSLWFLPLSSYYASTPMLNAMDSQKKMSGFVSWLCHLNLWGQSIIMPLVPVFIIVK